MRLPLMAAAWSIVIAAAAGVGWWRVESARGEVRMALGAAQQAQADCARVMALRSVGAVARGRRPDADLVARAHRALVAAGMPTSACSGVQPRADQQRAGGVHVQGVQLKLVGLTPGDLGAWLGAWRTAEQPWQVTDLQMVHANPGTGAAAQALDPNRYDVTVALAAPYLEDKP